MLPYPKIASASLSSVQWAVGISKDWFCSATLQDGRQLPHTHVPHLPNEALVFKSLNQNLTVYWLNVCLGRHNTCQEIDDVHCIPSRESVRERILKARGARRQLQQVQLNFWVSRACNPQPLNPSRTISTLVHLNPPDLHACNHHFAACHFMASHYTFIPL